MSKMHEIMAPAGSRESLAAALKAGADSVYFGIEALNMRAHSASRFTIDDLREIAATCNAQGVKSYLTVNTIIYDEDLELMRRICDAAKEAGISAVIAAEGRWMSVHVGDSRCYRITGEEVWRTEDQSPVERMFRDGEITEDQMNTHSMSNILDHCFGDDGWEWLMTDNLGNDWDRLVLCSDGAFGYMSVSDFRSLLTSGLTAEEMMNECYERGSTDNITILALDRMRDARAGP